MTPKSAERIDRITCCVLRACIVAGSIYLVTLSVLGVLAHLQWFDVTHIISYLSNMPAIYGLPVCMALSFIWLVLTPTRKMGGQPNTR